MVKLPDPSLPWPICREGVALIAEREGCRLKAYRCLAGKWTCGWGETEGVGPRTVWTQEYADQRLCDSMSERAAAVAVLCKIEPTENQFAALVSLSYNIGIGALAKSTVLRQHNAGNHDAAARAFALWNKYRNPKTGRLEVSDGLTARRMAEAALYLKPDSQEPQAMPQAVAAESKMAASPIAQGGAVTAGAGVVTALSAASDQIGLVGSVLDQLRAIADGLHIQPNVLLGAALLAAGAAIVYWRYRQRKEGWA